MVDVSVVIPTWNNAERLGITLDAIAACRIPDGMRWEVILVANACTDRTRDAAAPFAARLPLIYLEEPRQGSSNARNRGVAEARGALILFTDDDVRPCSNWVALYWSVYQATGNHHYFGGPLRSEFEDGWRPEPELLRVANRSVAGFDYGPRARALGPGEEFLEANWACPAPALKVVGGYSPQLGLDGSTSRRRVGEGLDLMERLNRHGLTPHYVPEAEVRHFVPRRKVTVRAIGRAYRAQGVYAARRPPPSFYLDKVPGLRAVAQEERAVGAGLRLWSAFVNALRDWLVARLAGRKGYAEYASLQFWVGCIEVHAGDLMQRLRRRRQ